jgi:hypothetical protein
MPKYEASAQFDTQQHLTLTFMYEATKKHTHKSGKRVFPAIALTSKGRHRTGEREVESLMRKQLEACETQSEIKKLYRRAYDVKTSIEAEVVNHNGRVIRKFCMSS